MKSLSRLMGPPTVPPNWLRCTSRVLPVSVEHCLLRIGQAAITNAAEHAQAQEVAVALSFEAGRVRLRVRDDGQGFDADLPCLGRFGIIGMRERAEKVGGEFRIVSHPGQGTQVDLTVPVLQEALEQEAVGQDER